MKLLIGIAIISLVSAGRGSGRCPKPIFRSEFDISRYLGVWYEIVRSTNVEAEYGDCNYQKVVKDQSGKLSFENYQRVDGEYKEEVWDGFCESRQNFLGRCYYKPDPKADWTDYQVISIDYETYVVVYSCTSAQNSHLDNIWVGARDKNLDWTLYQDIVINQLGFSLDELNTNVQNGNCPPIPVD